METSDRARARSERFSRLNFSVRIRDDVPGMAPAVEFAKRRMQDRQHRKFLKEANKRAAALAFAQDLNGPNLYVDRYAPLFELLLAVPSCLELMESDTVALERHPTGLRLKCNSREARKTSILPQSEAPKYVTVRTLYDLGDGAPSYDLRPVGLAVETSGYWKMLPPGSEGRDRNNNPVQGKTWVTTQTSWFESNSSASSTDSIRIDTPTLAVEEIGTLYVVRNATHPRDVYKIGFTMKEVDERARQLGATSGQPDIFNVVQAWLVRSPRLIEHEVHELLKDHRINTGREFFCLKYERIREAIERVIEKASAAV